MSLNTNLNNVTSSQSPIYIHDEENENNGQNVMQDDTQTLDNNIQTNYMNSGDVLTYLEYKSYVKINPDNNSIINNAIPSSFIDSSTSSTNSEGTETNPETLETIVPQIVTQANKIAINSTNIDTIKAAVYNYRHPSVVGITTTYGTTFNAIARQLDVTPSHTITKAGLTSYIRQYETTEDSNNDLYGALNFAFSDRNYDDEITYRDLQLFFQRGAGTDNKMTLNEYKTVVNAYADKVQNTYKNLPTAQKKLEFILDKTEDYLKASGLQLQLNAMNRLKEENGTTNTNPNHNQVARVGQIAFADLGGWVGDDTNGYTITNGSYNFYTVPLENSNPFDSGNRIYGSSWWLDDNDNDNPPADMGITLNTNYLNGYNIDEYGNHVEYNWYELVEVMVHELTHATAYFYYDFNSNSNGDIYEILASSSGLDYMQNKGIISAEQRAFIENNSFTMATSESQDVADAAYYLSTMWGEYSAYIQSANYYDSIAGDIFNSGHDLCVNKNQEKSAIENHIATLYDSIRNIGEYEAKPADSNWDLYA